MSNSFDDQFDESQIPDASESGAEEYNQGGTEVSARRVSAEPVPGFGYYVLSPRGATLSYEFDDKNRPVGRHRFEVVEGPQGTVGQTLFADQKLYAQRERWTNNKDANGRAIMEPLSTEELAESFRKFNSTMGRIQQAFGLTQRTPTGKSAQALSEYLAQFDSSANPMLQNVVAEVKRQTKNGFTKNVIWFDSIAGLNETAIDPKFKTALLEAQAKIAAKNKTLAAIGKKAGTSAPRQVQSASSPALD